MVNRTMRLVVFFDLPVVSKKDRKNYAQFRNYLIKNGYFMVQYSVYSKITQNHDDARKNISLLKQNLPSKGAVRVMQVTEKQYNAMEILVGSRTAEENFLFSKDLLEI